jgi:hypothetical protein
MLALLAFLVFSPGAYSQNCSQATCTACAAISGCNWCVTNRNTPAGTCTLGACASTGTLVTVSSADKCCTTGANSGSDCKKCTAVGCDFCKTQAGSDAGLCVYNGAAYSPGGSGSGVPCDDKIFPGGMVPCPGGSGSDSGAPSLESASVVVGVAAAVAALAAR